MSGPLLGQSLESLEAWAVAEGQPAFRGRQLHEWLYRRGVHDVAAITVWPRAWRDNLRQRQEHEQRPSKPHGLPILCRTTSLALSTCSGPCALKVVFVVLQRIEHALLIGRE